MTIREKIKDRLKSEPKSLYVEAWDETIYVTPISCGEMSKLQKRHPDFLTNLHGEAMVDLIITKALTKDGEKAFDRCRKTAALGQQSKALRLCRQIGRRPFRDQWLISLGRGGAGIDAGGVLSEKA